MALIYEPTIGAKLAGGLTQGFGSGLQSLMDMKLNKMIQKKQLRTGLQALLPGLEPERYDQLSEAPMELLQPYLKQELKRPQEEAFARAIGGQGAQPGDRLSGEQALKLSEHKMKQQKAINEENKLYVNPIIESYQPSVELEKKIDEAINLVRSGQLSSGISGRLQSAAGLYNTDASQRYDTVINDIINAQAQFEKGNPGKFRLDAIRAGKAGLNQSDENKLKYLNSVKERARHAQDEYNALQDVIKEHGDNQPKNINKYIKAKVKQNDKTSKELEKRLGAPQEDGTVVEDNGEYFMSMGGEWESIAQDDPRLLKLLQGA